MYKQGKRGNILYSAVGGGSFYNGYNILTPPPLPCPIPPFKYQALLLCER